MPGGLTIVVDLVNGEYEASRVSGGAGLGFYHERIQSVLGGGLGA